MTMPEFETESETGSRTTREDMEKIIRSISLLSTSIDRFNPAQTVSIPIKPFPSSQQDVTNIIINIREQLERIEEHLGMNPEKDSDPTFDFDSENFDGLKALRRMNREADEAIARATVVLEDTRSFIKSRKLKPSL